jgi:hypothetical protein
MPHSLGGFRLALSVSAVLVAGVAPAATGPGSPHSSHRSREDSYVLAVGASTTISNASVDEMVRLQGDGASNVLWFRRAGKAYLVEDPATLNGARELFAPLRALEPEQEELRRREQALDDQEEKLDRREEDIDRQMDAASEDGNLTFTPLAVAEQERLERDLREIRSRQREIQAAARELERVERDLDAREDAIEREAESKLWTLIDAAIKKGVAKPI